MKEFHIRAFCSQFSQSFAAQIMGCTQSAVSQMVISGRDVRIIQHPDNSYSYYEIKKPKGKKAA